MKNKLFIINVISFMLIALFAAGSCYAETKKVLVLQIIEENWDDLEFYLPKYRGAPKPITKKEALKEFEEYREKVIKKDSGIKEAMKRDVVKTIRQTAQKNIIIPQKDQPESIENSLYIKHEIVYLGKAYYLKEGDSFNKDAFRGRVGNEMDRINLGYYYNNLPEKISLLLSPKTFDKTRGKFIPYKMNNFKEIRLVEEFYILSINETGNLKIKYDDKEYMIKVGSVVELPIQEKILTREEMMTFREKYVEFYTKEYPWKNPRESITSSLIYISIPNKTFRFGTKVTIINHGFEEIQGE